MYGQVEPAFSESNISSASALGTNIVESASRSKSHKKKRPSAISSFSNPLTTRIILFGQAGFGLIM